MWPSLSILPYGAYRGAAKRERDYTNSLASASCLRYKTGMNTYENPSAALESLQARIVALRDSL